MASEIINEDKDSSLSLWIHILNEYDDHKDEFSDEEILRMYKECEECRKMFNRETRYDKVQEDDVNAGLYLKARKIMKDKWNGAITSSHSIGR